MSRTFHHGDNAKKRLFGHAWRWIWNEPRWWQKLFNHVPARRKERDKLARLDEDDYPDRRKPHKYYW